MKTKTLITESDLLEVLQGRVQAAGTAKRVCEELRFTPQFVSDILAGRRRISPRLANALGYEVMPTMYRRKAR